MNAVIDWGNTRCKWAIFEGPDMLHSYAEKEEGLTAFIDHTQKHGGIEHLLLSSVVNIKEEDRKYLSVHFKLVELTPGTRLPIINAYKTPETLGNDRLAAAVGAAHLYPGRNVLVVDAGTCVKFDFIDSTGHYLGGSIAPGIGMRLKALQAFTDRLPLVEAEQDAVLIGGTTRESILSGVINGVKAEADGMISAYKERYPDLVVVLTGGDSNFFDKKLKNSTFAAPHLVFVGLNEILRCNV